MKKFANYLVSTFSEDEVIFDLSKLDELLGICYNVLIEHINNNTATLQYYTIYQHLLVAKNLKDSLSIYGGDYSFEYRMLDNAINENIAEAIELANEIIK